MIKMDELDLEIIDRLGADSRISTNTLAKQLKKPRHVVAYRRKKLYSDGVIRGDRILLDFQALGFQEFVVYWKFYNYLEHKQKVLDTLKASKNIRWSAEVFPKYNLRTVFLAKTIIELEKIINDLEQKLSGLVETKVILLNNELLKVPIHSTTHIKMQNCKAPAKLDDVDKKMLNLLSEKPSTSLLQLSNHTKLTIEATRKRLHYLKNHVLLSIHSQISPDKIDINFWCNLLVKLNNFSGNEKKLKSLIFSGREYGRTRKLFGEWNLEMSVSVHNQKELVQLIHEIETRFGDDFQAYELLVYTHKYLDQALPDCIFK